MRTFGVLGTGFLLVVPLLCGLLRFPGKGSVDPQTLEEESAVRKAWGGAEIPPSGIAKTAAFYGLWVCFMIGVFTGLMAIGIASPVGQEIIRLSPVTATAFISVFAVFNGGGRALFGWLTDRITPRYAAMLSFLIVFFCSLGMLNARQGDVLLYAACFSGFWLIMGGWLAMAPASTLRFFGSGHYASNYGLVFTANGVGSVLGNLVAGKLRDLLGSYVYAFWPTLALAAAGMAVAFFLMRPPRKK
jgi:MFS family permease